jgi:hypothetical protein
MRRIWSYGFLLTLTGCVAAGQGVAGGADPYAARDWLVDARANLGHPRSQAERLADGRACNSRAQSLFPYDQAAFDKVFYRCLSQHGWRVARSVPGRASPSYQPPDAYDPNFGVGSLSPPSPPLPPPPPPPVGYNFDGTTY